jgi:hypothetical protein
LLDANSSLPLIELGVRIAAAISALKKSIRT